MKLNIDWKSKIIDLLIVIVGISIAFKLNTWNESIKTDLEAKNYIESFYEENRANEANLVSALKYSESNIKKIDTLKQILLSKNYEEKRIKNLALRMLGQSSFTPSITTMENVTASGEFKFIKNIELRRKIINTYKSFQRTLKLEEILFDYSNDYLSPFLFENVRYSDFSSIDSDYFKKPFFENIVIAYSILLGQQIRGYQSTLEKIKLLDEELTITKKSYSQ